VFEPTTALEPRSGHALNPSGISSLPQRVM
jgi:hypothetical protein